MSDVDVIRDGKLIRGDNVAVLISPGFGAGWSTWAHGNADERLYDPELVRLVLEGARPYQLENYCEKRWPGDYFGGLEQLVVRWIPIGTQFYVHEYDGSESIKFQDDDNWRTA